VKWGLSALAAAAAVTVAPAAQSSRPETTAPPPLVTIRVTITDSKITLHPKRGQRGSIAQFVVLNLGKKPHAFKLGHEQRGRGVQTGFTTAVKPKEQKIHLQFLDYRGKLPYFGSLPADRSKPGMKGVFTIF